MRNRSKAGIIAFGSLWVVGFLVSVALGIGIVVVAIHFIHKFW